MKAFKLDGKKNSTKRNSQNLHERSLSVPDQLPEVAVSKHPPASDPYLNANDQRQVLTRLATLGNRMSTAAVLNSNRLQQQFHEFRVATLEAPGRPVTNQKSLVISHQRKMKSII